MEDMGATEEHQHDMTPSQLRRIRTRLVGFAEDLFDSIARKDQRRWGQTYLRGLLLDGKRKSIQPMATRLARGDPQADPDALEQALQQFVNQSPWDPVPVRRWLAQRMTTTIGPQAWVIDDSRVAPAHCCAGAPSEPDVPVAEHPAQASPTGSRVGRSAGSLPVPVWGCRRWQ
jgi:hypothetical protein